MDFGALFLILAVILLAGLFVYRPFFDNQSSSAELAPSQNLASDQERSSLLAEYDRQLNALQELDFDHVLGKIPVEDYPLQRSAMLKYTASLLRSLDVLEVKSSSEEQSEASQAEERIEAAIAARRAAVTQPQAGDDLEALIAARRRTRQEKASGFCPHCGKPILRTDKFCPKCGQSL